MGTENEMATTASTTIGSTFVIAALTKQQRAIPLHARMTSHLTRDRITDGHRWLLRNALGVAAFRQPHVDQRHTQGQRVLESEILACNTDLT